MCQFLAPSVLGACSLLGTCFGHLACFLPFDHDVPRVPHMRFCLFISFYPVSFGICPGCLLRRLLLRLYVDCWALGLIRWWFNGFFHLSVRCIVFLCFWSLLWPLFLCGEFLWTSVSPLASDGGREGPLCAVLEVGFPLLFAASLQVCSLGFWLCLLY